MTSFPGNKSNWQQPFWSDKDMLALVISELDTLPELLNFEEISEFNKALAAVYAGKAMIFQAGDCAERICESGALHVRKKLTFLEQMSRELSTLTGLPILTVGRIAGQYAKEGANKWGNSSRLTQSFHFFMFEPIFSPVNALNQPI